MRESVEHFLKNCLDKVGLRVEYSWRPGFRMENVIKRASKRSTSVKTIFDIGASDGRWSKECFKFFPDVKYHMIEASPAHEEALKRLCSKKRNFSYSLVACSDHDGEEYFSIPTKFGGAISDNGRGVRVPSRTLDSLSTEKNLEPNYFLKLDTHGFETQILNGAREVLKSTELLIVESYNFQLNKSALRFWDFCKAMEERGFLCVDLADPMIRPKDSVLWQLDLVFARKSSSCFNDLTYD